MRKRTRKSLSCVHVLQKSEIKQFHVAVVQRLQRNVQKRRDARAKLLFCQSKSIAFLPFPLPSPLLLLKLPTVTCLKTCRVDRTSCCPPISFCTAFHSKRKMVLYVVGQNKIQVHIVLIYSYMYVLHFLCVLTNI